MEIIRGMIKNKITPAAQEPRENAVRVTGTGRHDVFSKDDRGCPLAWTTYALHRQYARVIWRAKQSGNTGDPLANTGVEPIRQLSVFFHQRPGLRVVIGTTMLKFIGGDAQSTNLRPDHPAVLTFKRRYCKKKCKRNPGKFWLYFATTIPGAVLAVALGIAASLMNGFGPYSRLINGGLQSCMDDVGLGQFCLNNSYQCGGSSSLSSINITSVSSNPNPYCMRFDSQPLSVFNKCNPCIG